MNVIEIRKKFGQRLVGTPYMKKLVCQTVSIFPEDIIEKITFSVWFISSLRDAWAFTFTGADIKDQHLIFLSDELLSEEEPQVIYTIAHEIGHVILGHKNSIGYTLTQSEIKQQEKEADAFVRKYLYN